MTAVDLMPAVILAFMATPGVVALWRYVKRRRHRDDYVSQQYRSDRRWWLR
jgi:hypothetical protein